MNTIILAGGKSSRMGRNKALMTLKGERIIDRIVTEFKPVSKNVVLITNDQSPYTNLDVKVKADHPLYRGQGPLAGIYTGLEDFTDDVNLVIACDMPFATKELALEMLEKIGDRDAVIPTTKDHVHPLFAVYHGRIVDRIKTTLEEKRRSMKALVEQLNVQYIPLDEKAVWNMNTVADYEKAVELVERNE